VAELEAGSNAVVGENWTLCMSAELIADLRRFRSYKTHSLVDLLRAIRNKRHHYMELPSALKASLGDLPDGFSDYFHSRYPLLLRFTVGVVKCSPAKFEPMFAQYFTTPTF
jgi:hypothetical protein